MPVLGTPGPFSPIPPPPWVGTSLTVDVSTVFTQRSPRLQRPADTPTPWGPGSPRPVAAPPAAQSPLGEEHGRWYWSPEPSRSLSLWAMPWSPCGGPGHCPASPPSLALWSAPHTPSSTQIHTQAQSAGCKLLLASSRIPGCHRPQPPGRRALQPLLTQLNCEAAVVQRPLVGPCLTLSAPLQTWSPGAQPHWRTPDVREQTQPQRHRWALREAPALPRQSPPPPRNGTAVLPLGLPQAEWPLPSAPDPGGVHQLCVWAAGA